MLKITKIENELKKWDQDFQRFDNEEVVSETVLENDFYENIYNFLFSYVFLNKKFSKMCHLYFDIFKSKLEKK